jgi:hypothetical protein
MVETIAASSISFWLAWEFNSVEHIVIASSLVPFLLLRTRLSTRYTIHTFNILTLRYGTNSNLTIVVSMFILLITIICLIPLIKIMCLIKVVLRKPLQSISSIPTNFYKYVFVTDSLQSPEVVPGSNEIKSEYMSNFNAYNMIRVFGRMFVYASPNDNKSIPVVIGSIFGMLFLFITFGALLIALVSISISFRFSIKSTALLWLPLLWIIHQAQPGANVLDRIQLDVKLPSTKLMLAYSICVALGFVVKLGLLFEVWKFTKLSWSGPPLEVLATRLVAPYDLPLWQVTSALNAGLAWAYFFRAKRYLLARYTAEAAPERRIQREYVAFQVVRTIFSLYAIACTLYIAAATASQIQWPPIHLILFPRI